MFKHLSIFCEWHFYTWKEKKLKQNSELFLHILLKIEIIWMRIGQVIKLQNDISVSETPCIIKQFKLQTWNFL